MTKGKPREQAWVLMLWVSFLSIIVATPAILAEPNYAYQIGMFTAVGLILVWAAVLLHSSLRSAPKDISTIPPQAEGGSREISERALAGQEVQQPDEEEPPRPVGAKPLVLGGLIALWAMALVAVLLKPELAKYLWAIVFIVAASVVLGGYFLRVRKSPPGDSKPQEEKQPEQEKPQEPGGYAP
jgi:membrane protein implicated in regulation of membrane protease activity